MLTKIQRWGNSLAVRIPKSFAADARVGAGSAVDITVEGDELVIRPVRRRRYDLRDLVAGINARNLHDAVDTGEPVGREAW